jgi:ABC-type multidrug transport system permease subunit
MRGAAALARHDLRLTLSDRSALMWAFVFPLLFALFLGLVMRGGGSPADLEARLTVVDHDGGWLARALVERLAGAQVDVVELTPAERETAEGLVRTLVIPAGFTDSVVAGETVTLRLELEAGTNLQAALLAQTRLFAGVSRMIAQLVAVEEVGGAPDPEAIARLAAEEDLVQVEASFAGEATVVPSGFQQSVPGNLVMFVLLVALTYGAASLAAERQGGQLRRLASAPVSRAEIVAGKLGGRLAVAVVQVTVLVLFAWVGGQVIGFGLGDRPWAVWLVLVVYGCAVAPLGILVGALLRDPDRAANVGVIVTLVMAALGGCWWPLEVVSPTLQRVALLFPTGWTMGALHQLIAFGRGLEAVALPLAVLLGFGLLFTVFSARLLRI